MKYLLNVVNTYRVESVPQALKLREELSESKIGDLISFTYTQKNKKSKGEIVDEWVICKAKIGFNSEQEPELDVNTIYEYNM